MRATATSVLVAVAVLVTSCAAEGNDADEAVVEVEPADAEPAAEVELVGFSFAPETIEITVGDTVRWTNRDATRHTVTAGVDAEPTDVFHLTLDDRGDSAALTFTEPGEYRYFCTPHPFMEGTVSVGG